MSPFNQARYERLLKGLEVTEVPVSPLNDEWRLDPEYFQKKYFEEDARQSKFASIYLGSQAFITDGQHGYHVIDEKSGIAMLTANCVSHWFADRSEAISIASTVHASNQRSALETDDLLLSTRGTVGACAIVEPDVLPANLDQDVARILLSPDTPVTPHYVLTYLNCRFGQDWCKRNATGMVQQGLSLARVRTLPVPVLSHTMQAAIEETVRAASQRLHEAAALASDTEQTLLQELGLANWQPPEAQSYVRSSHDAFAAGRLDAEYFTPKVTSLLSQLGHDGTCIGDVAPARHEAFRRAHTGTFDYIEIGSLATNGSAAAEALDMIQAPSRATQHVRAGDVITSTVRPIRRLSALIADTQDGAVCSSGFVVLDPRQTSGATLLTYLRLPLICELMDVHTTATMYPAIAEANLLALPFPRITGDVDQAIQNQVRQSSIKRTTADYLLDAAKCAVEIAIEDSEARALGFLEQAMQPHIQQGSNT